jgi:CelD/BcsL family acetyltransferase involved in cellulose biosynthesis
LLRTKPSDTNVQPQAMCLSAGVWLIPSLNHRAKSGVCVGKAANQESLTVNSRSETHATLEIWPAARKPLPEAKNQWGSKVRKMPSGRPGATRTVVVRDVRDLEEFTPAWMELAKNAIDPNAFYEPWWLIPSLRHLDPQRKTLFVFIFAPDPDCPTRPEKLCGMFPFELASNYRGLPSRVLRSLRPTYNRLCTPLVHSAFVPECVGTLLDWAEHSRESAPLVEFRFITGEGRVAQELHQQISERHWTALQSDCTTRALFRPMSNADAYLGSALRGKHLKEFRRLEKRLGEGGPTEYRCLERQGDAAPWIASFLELESSGWKGQDGSSLASRTETCGFFREAALEAHRHGQLMMLGLFHRHRPIALKCNLVSGRGSVAFKIAFDEEYARYSPGMLLEIENLRRLHDMPEIAWMDSTAESRHFMINRLWIDRRTVETLVVSPNRAWGNFIASSFPFLRWVKCSAYGIFEGFDFRKKTKEIN